MSAPTQPVAWPISPVDDQPGCTATDLTSGCFASDPGHGVEKQMKLARDIVHREFSSFFLLLLSLRSHFLQTATTTRRLTCGETPVVKRMWPASTARMLLVSASNFELRMPNVRSRSLLETRAVLDSRVRPLKIEILEISIVRTDERSEATLVTREGWLHQHVQPAPEGSRSKIDSLSLCLSVSLSLSLSLSSLSLSCAPVARKWPKWLVANLQLEPVLGGGRGTIITPALFSSTCSDWYCALTAQQEAFTLQCRTASARETERDRDREHKQTPNESKSSHDLARLWCRAA